MLNIKYIRALAEAERLMDDGKIPFVWAKNAYGELERLSVNPQIMKEFNLRQGQSVNSIIVDAISIRSMEIIHEKLEQVTQELEDSLLDPDFDYRIMIDDDNY
jgi:hypothetical protein